jgi:hypothetical protein
MQHAAPPNLTSERERQRDSAPRSTFTSGGPYVLDFKLDERAAYVNVILHCLLLVLLLLLCWGCGNGCCCGGGIVVVVNRVGFKLWIVCPSGATALPLPCRD